MLKIIYVCIWHTEAIGPGDMNKRLARQAKVQWWSTKMARCQNQELNV